MNRDVINGNKSDVKMKDSDKATLRLRVWIEQENELYIGIGSTLLLKHIEKLGSLRKAAEALGMSYRRAWGKLKNAEQRIGRPLVEKTRGKGQRFNLSPFGKELMEKFLQFYLDVEEYATTRAEEVLDMDVEKSGEFYRDDKQ